MSDNGTAFTSAEFQEFVRLNGIRHITSAPYHPASNGLAERAVQTLKQGLRKNATTDDMETRVSRFLFRYRITPHSTMGVSPAELLLGRRPRSQLDLMQPNVATRVYRNQVRQKMGHDAGTRDRTFSPNDMVFIHNFSTSGHTWLPGIVVEQKGSLAYLIKLADRCVVQRHIEHIRSRSSEPAVVEPSETPVQDDPLPIQ